MPAVFLLLRLNLELVEDSIGSKNPKAEVTPANKIAKKSKGAKIMSLKITKLEADIQETLKRYPNLQKYYK